MKTGLQYPYFLETMSSTNEAEMVEKIKKHYLEILGFCVVIICVLVGFCMAQVYHDGIPADVFEIRELNRKLSERIARSNIEFEHIEQAITTVTMRMMMWQDSNLELQQIVDCLTSITLSLDEIGYEIHRGVPE